MSVYISRAREREEEVLEINRALRDHECDYCCAREALSGDRISLVYLFLDWLWIFFRGDFFFRGVLLAVYSEVVHSQLT